MAPPGVNGQLRLALPKGRIQSNVLKLLEMASIGVDTSAREYRPTISLPDVEVKMLKPQNIVEMLHFGSRDLGFAGADWVAELEANVVELLDTELDPIRLVAAAPASLLIGGKLPERPLRVASEYEKLTMSWIRRNKLRATYIRTFGATEVFPPEDADCIVDNTATGATLVANRLEIIDELLCSSTRLFASPAALENPKKREAINSFVMLLESVLEARKRVMLEVNVSAETLSAVVEIIPCMQEPTIAPLYGDSGFGVKAAVPRADLPLLIPRIKERGGTDLVVNELAQIVP